MTFSKVLMQSLIWRGLYFITLFLVNLILSRYLKADGSGAIYYISNTFVFIQLLAGLCLENGITYFAAGGRMSGNRLLWLCLLWTAILVLLQLLAYRILPFTAHDLPPHKVSLYAFCFITGLLLTTYCANVFYATGNFFISNLILSLFNLSFIVYVTIAYGWLRRIGTDIVIDAYFYILLFQGIAVASICILKNKSWQEFALPSYPDIRKFLRYSLTVLLFNVLLFLVYRVDYYFVKNSPACTPSDLGNYIQASKLGQMMLVIPQIIGSAVYPQVSSGKDMENVGRIIVLLIKITAVIFILFFFFILLTGSRLFPFLFGSTFSSMQVPFLLLLPGVFGLAVISFLSNYFSGQGNVSISVRSAAFALILVLCGDILFVLRYGIAAAAVVSMVGYLVMCSPYVILFLRQQKMSVRHFFYFTKSDISLFLSLLKRKDM